MIFFILNVYKISQDDLTWNAEVGLIDVLYIKVLHL